MSTEEQLRRVVRQIRTELEWAARAGIVVESPKVPEAPARSEGTTSRPPSPAAPPTAPVDLPAPSAPAPQAQLREPVAPGPQANLQNPTASSSPPNLPAAVASAPQGTLPAAPGQAPQVGLQADREQEPQAGLRTTVAPDLQDNLQTAPAAAPQATLRPAPGPAPTSPHLAPPPAAALPVEAPARTAPSERPSPAGPRLPVLAEQLAACTSLEGVREVLGDCTRCKLAKQGRKQIVYGVGSPQAEIMFIGEGPGAEEDRRGEPFVGPAGELLTSIIENGMGLRRAEVYIANVVKCRPPQNRDPEPDEVLACEPFLATQIRVIKPKVLIALGKHAAHTLLGVQTPITRMRGKWGEYQGTPLMPTYHPAYLLRNPAEKRAVWEDVKEVLRFLGRPLPSRGTK